MRGFTFSVFKALPNALQCGDKFIVKFLRKAPLPPSFQGPGTVCTCTFFMAKGLLYSIQHKFKGIVSLTIWARLLENLSLRFITKTCLFKYTENIRTKKNENFQIKISNIFHISAQNIVCGYSLESSQRVGSNVYPQSMFVSRNMKKNVHPYKPQFYYIKVGFKGVKIIQACFRDVMLLKFIYANHFGGKIPQYIYGTSRQSLRDSSEVKSQHLSRGLSFKWLVNYSREYIYMLINYKLSLINEAMQLHEKTVCFNQYWPILLLSSLHKRNGTNFNFSHEETMRYLPSIARDTSTTLVWN